MGQFSWKAADTKRPIIIYDCPGGPTECFLLVPNEFKEILGTDAYFEPQYEGYGVFGGRDAYALLAICNLPESETTDENGNYLPDSELRGLGIDLQFNDYDKIKYPIKIVEGKCNYNEVGESPHDPNQGWGYDEDEEDDFY